MSDQVPPQEPVAPPAPTKSAIDPQLLENITVLKKLISIDNILTNCLFPGGAASDIVAAKNFINQLHAPLLKQCEAHPDFSKVTKPTSAPQGKMNRAQRRSKGQS